MYRKPQHVELAYFWMQYRDFRMKMHGNVQCNVHLKSNLRKKPIESNIWQMLKKLANSICWSWTKCCGDTETSNAFLLWCCPMITIKKILNRQFYQVDQIITLSTPPLSCPWTVTLDAIFNRTFYFLVQFSLTFFSSFSLCIKGIEQFFFFSMEKFRR